MMKWWLRSVSLLLIVIVMSSCGSDKNASQSPNAGYKDTKTMVLDILKTEDGRNAIQNAMIRVTAQDEGQLKLLSTGDTQQMKLAVKDVLTDTESNKFLQQLILDPRFAGQFAKAIQKDTKQLQKELMKDPEYQQALSDAMKNPDFQKMLMDTLKGPQYRQQMKTIMQESLQSPMFRLELMNLMKKVLEEEAMPKEQGQNKQQQSKGGSSSDQGNQSQKDQGNK
ncbi:spore germination lipoprotein GerD [Paenibacillus rigui]|uniref:Spore gernimation protein n=1 Tax=Paenibacillus rigui TaxID=554312 RepID=A0A229UI47_9BACL|nr:spore germination lipoprotein GerD [Paenibacillus rigui]OXM83092.1 spore gernimation protein [Paenibacillus rigui]